MSKGLLYRKVSGEISSENWWKLRNKAKKSAFRLINLYRYYHVLKVNCASIPLSCDIKSMPNFPHGIMGIFISMGAIIGHNCTIMHQVTIGSNTFKDAKKPGAPTIGDNVFIGAGAKIIGGVNIGNNVRIGANCCVATDIPDNSTVVSQSPRIIIHNETRHSVFVSWEDYHSNH